MSAKKKATGGSKRAKSASAPKKRAAGAKSAKAKTSAAKVKAKATKPAAKKAASKKALAKKAAPKKAAPKKLVAKSAKKAAPKKAAPKKLVAKSARKAAPKKAAPKKPAPKPEIRRRDGSGHLDPAYEADLRARIEAKPKDDERAFGGDALGNELGEEFVETVTSGEDEGTEIRDQSVTEELGGPFTVTTGGTEFAGDVDESNPEEATREPFPRT